MLRPLAPYIEFELRKDYIREFLCINKEKPITICGGQCYLGKQIERQSESETAEASLSLNIKDYPLALLLEGETLPKAEIGVDKFYPKYTEPAYSEPLSDFLKPPQNLI
ncbi:hypothetical protein [Fulvitalea axinellae]